MATQTQGHFGLTSLQLKLLALITMTFDHACAYLPTAFGIPSWFRLIGRLAAPLFLFLCAEGFAHTRSRKKYLQRLYLASVLMAAGNLVVNHYFSTDSGLIIINAMFQTMFLIVWTLCCIELLRGGVREKQRRKILLGIGGLVLMLIASALPIAMAVFLKSSTPVWLFVTFQLYSILVPNLLFAEGSFLWLLLGVAFYYLRERPIVRAVAFTLFWLIEGFFSHDPAFAFCGWLSLIPITFYNGTPGRRIKTFFYVYYPVHVYVLFVANWFFTTQC